MSKLLSQFILNITLVLAIIQHVSRSLQQEVHLQYLVRSMRSNLQGCGRWHWQDTMLTVVPNDGHDCKSDCYRSATGKEYFSSQTDAQRICLACDSSLRDTKERSSIKTSADCCCCAALSSQAAASSSAPSVFSKFQK